MEQEAVRLSEQKTETEKKEEALSQALSRVWEDAQMLSLLQEKRDVVRGEQEKIEQETRALKTKIKETESAFWNWRQRQKIVKASFGNWKSLVRM